MANTTTLLEKRRVIGNYIVFVFQVIVSGSYVQGGAAGTPGETINLNAAANPQKIARPKLPGAPAGKLPPNQDIVGTTEPGGYYPVLQQNASNPTQANYAMRVFTSGGTELGAGAYPAAITNDPTGFVFEVRVPWKYN